MDRMEYGKPARTCTRPTRLVYDIHRCPAGSRNERLSAFSVPAKWLAAARMGRMRNCNENTTYGLVETAAGTVTSDANDLTSIEQTVTVIRGV